MVQLVEKPGVGDDGKVWQYNESADHLGLAAPRDVTGILSVKAFGAAGDDTGNDQAAFAAAATALGSGGGSIYVPPGTYRFTTMFDQPLGVSVLGAGSSAVTIHAVGAITAWRYKPSGGVGQRRDSIAGLTILGTSSGVAGLQISDCFGFGVQDVTVDGFSAGVGVLFHNVTAWTENASLNRVHCYGNSVGIRFQRTTGSGGTDSFGYQRWENVAVNVPASGIGIDIGQSAACTVYRATVNAVIWVGSSGTAVRVQSGSALEGLFMLAGEIESGATSTVGISNSGSIEVRGLVHMTAVASNTFGDYRLSLEDPIPTIAEHFVDDFASFDKARWITSADASISSGRARLQATSTYAYDIRSNELVNLTESSLYVQIDVAATGSDGSVETFFELVDFFSDSSLSFIKSDTSLTFRNRTSGSNSSTSVTYSATDHAWWRLTETGGSVNFDTSPDGRTWTTRRTVTPSWNYANLQVTAQAAYWGTPGAGPFYAYIQGINVRPVDLPVVLEYLIGDETTTITTGTSKLTVRAPFAFTVTAVRSSLATESSSGVVTVDINDSGTTILSTKLSIDANEKTSTTAATPPVISDTAIADDAELTFDVDAAGTGAKGLKVKLIGTRFS